MNSALRLPSNWATSRGKLGLPVGNPGMTIETPNKSPAHFNQGSRRSNGDCSGNTAKKKKKSGHNLLKKNARNANANARRGGEINNGLRRSGAATKAQNSKARSHAFGSSSLKNRTVNATKRKGMG